MEKCKIFRVLHLIAWHPNRNGLFTVKSAYHCQWAHKFASRNYTAVAGGSGLQPVWKKLWKLSMPSKVKIFVWRALHGCIPCFAILANKHITDIVNCPVCKTEAEDIRHILFSCSRARDVEKLLIIDRSGSVLIQEIIRRGGEDTELILTGCWYIWWQRRQLVHGEDIQNPSRSAMSIAAITANYFTAAKKVTVINQGWRNRKLSHA